jgi:RNA polymerase sigma-70 factor (ECF subfamily)
MIRSVLPGTDGNSQSDRILVIGTQPCDPEAQEPNGEDRRILEALRGGDEQAFATLVQRHYPSMLSVAMHYVSSRAIAEEVVQEAWIGVLKGLVYFEARSSLKTWIFRILINRAKTQMRREGRSIPFSSLAAPADDPFQASVDRDRFWDADHPKWPHHWRVPPQDWGGTPEERLLSAETEAYIRRAIDRLPPNQRAVITLRDIEGWKPNEVCTILKLTDATQRVLLHRARSKVRQSMEQYPEPGERA